MSDKKFNDAELLTDDELEQVAGGFRLESQYHPKSEIPPYIQELVRQFKENRPVDMVNGETRQ